MNTITNPFNLYKERSFNELFSIAFQYISKYKKSFFVPVLILGVPVQVFMLYFYLDTYGSILAHNPFLGPGIKNQSDSMILNSLLIIVLAILSFSVNIGLIFSHISLFALPRESVNEKEPHEVMVFAKSHAVKILKAVMMTVIVILAYTLPLLLLFILLAVLFGWLGAIAGGVFFIFFAMLALFFLLPPLSYLSIITPFVFLIKQNEEGYFAAFRRLYKGFFKNFWKSWLFAFLCLILLYVSQMIAMLPMMIFMLSGLFGKSSAGATEVVYKIIFSSFSSILASVVYTIISIMFIYLMGNNEEIIYRHSLRREIENL